MHELLVLLPQAYISVNKYNLDRSPTNIINKFNVIHSAIIDGDGFIHPGEGRHHLYAQHRRIHHPIQFLNNNFIIVKQCLLKIQELEGSLGQEKETSKQFSNRLKQIESNLTSNQQEIKNNGEKIKELQNNVGDEFMVIFN